MDKETAFSKLRESMVAKQIEARGIRDERLLEALRLVPRHRFIDSQYHEAAYDDQPLPIPCHQTISQPYIVALMTALLHLKGTEKVLEIGTGSGYQAAILSHLAREVHTIEVFPELGERAREILKELDIQNVCVYIQDGSKGLPEQAPFDGMMVTAAAPGAPRPLLEQLAPEGRLVIPVGGSEGQVLQVWRREGDKFTRDEVALVAFVPLRGEYGWRKEDWYYRGE